MTIDYTIIILIFIICIYILFRRLYIESYNDAPTYESKQIEINKGNYSNYLKEKSIVDDILKDYNDKHNKYLTFSYTKQKGVNDETLGFCPLGEYYSEKKFSKNLAHCSECKKCNEKPGWYLGGGCLGDKDSLCEFGKLPLDLYLRGHSKGSMIHDSLYEHQHKYIDYNGDEKLSDFNHKH